ncbi:MAG: class I SAM-dependent methyltransferase [Pseudomonadota bacterium]
MTQEDKQRWNDRYAAGAYEGREHPAALLEQWVDSAAPGRALDLACGRGRNARYLAARGFAVTAVDIADVAISAARARAVADGLDIDWRVADLDGVGDVPAFGDAFQLILIMRYADLALAGRAARWLAPGGLLIVEAHVGGALHTDDVGGPRGERLRLAPGSLEAALAPATLEVCYAREERVVDPDGAPMALARFVGQRRASG